MTHFKGQSQDPAALSPEKRQGSHCAGGWVGLRADLDEYGYYRLHRFRIPKRPSYTETLYRLSYPSCTV